MMKKHVFLFLLFFLFLALTPVKAQAPAESQDVMLQAFYWDSYNDSKWTTLNQQTTEISSNFTLVWLPPSANSTGWMGYLPIRYFDQSSSFGSKDELKTLIASLKAKGTRCVADIVINHRAPVSDWANLATESYGGVTFTPNMSWICSDDECKDHGFTPTGAPDTGETYGERDLDHTNVDVQNNIKAYLKFMKNDMGFDGWRYDMTKGYNGKYNAIYNDDAGAYMSVGEYWDGDFNKCNAWIKAASYKSTTFDFPLKYQINKAFANNNLTLLATGGLIHDATTKRYAVTFIDNHDTGRDDSRFTGNVLAANAFILSSPGIPCVWLSHWKTYKDQIKQMIAARKAAGIHSESAVTVSQSSSNLYVATVTGKKGKLIVKIGSGSYTAPTGYTLSTSGTDYAIWLDATNSVPSLSVTPDSGVYPTGTNVTFTASGGTAPVDVYYTTNGDTPTTASTKVSSGTQINVSGGTTLKAVAIDAAGISSDVTTKEYKLEQSSIIVRWKNDLNWTGSMYIYAWDSSQTALLGAWPGTVVTANALGWYASKFDLDNVNVIFNNGTNQTVDILNITSSTCYQINNTKQGTGYTVTAITCTNTKVDDVLANRLDIYPIPSTETVHLQGVDNIAEISAYNLSGQKIKDFEIVNNSINIEDMAKGIYLLRVSTTDGNYAYKKIVKE